MKTSSLHSPAVFILLLLGQSCNALFPCFYLNKFPWITASICPLTWTQEQIYAGGLGNYFVMSLDGTVVAFSTDERTVRVMKKSVIGNSWEPMGDDDIHLSSGDRITGLELDEDGTSLAIESLSRSSSVMDVGYVYKFQRGSLCLASLGLFFCASSSWEKEASFLDVYQMSFSASGNRIAIAASTTDQVKVYTRQQQRRSASWEQIGSTITGVGGSDSMAAPSVYLDASGTTVMVVQSSQAQLFQLVGVGCTSSSSFCEFEKHGSALTSDSGSFLILPARENGMESVVALELMGSSITSTFQRLSCPVLDECIWEEDSIFEEVINTTGKIIFPNIDGSTVIARDLGVSNEWQAFQEQIFLGWDPVADAYEFTGSFNAFHNIMSPSGDFFVSMTGGDVYIVSLS